jgi:hypothetical protein
VTDTADTNAAAAGGARDGATTYAERLYVTWYWWPLPLLAAGILAAEVHMGYAGIRAWLPYATLLPLTVLLLLRMGRMAICVGNGELWVGKAHLPAQFVGKVEVIAPEDKRRTLGRELDPAAFVLHRGWIGPLVRVHLADPTDPTPYWLVSTRHPDRLARALGAAH